jgi:hypothetical protein
MNNCRITYAQRPDATSEVEVAALSNIFRFILDSHSRKEAAPENRLDDAKESDVSRDQHHSR